MASSRDIKLVIKATNDADGAINAVAKALEKLLGAQENVSGSATDAAKNLSSLAKDMIGVDRVLSGLTGKFSQAESALSRQNLALAETRNQLEAVRAQAQTAATALEKLKAANADSAKIKAVQAEYNRLNATINALEGSIEKQVANIRPTELALQRLASSTNAVEDAQRKGKAAFDAGTEAIQKQSLTLKEFISRQEELRAARSIGQGLAAFGTGSGPGLASGAMGGNTDSRGRPTNLPLGLSPYQLQNLSYQVNDFFTQIASGTPITQAFAQQIGQVVQIFDQFGASVYAIIPTVLRLAPALAVVGAAVFEIVSRANRLRDFEKFLDGIAGGARLSATALEEYVQTLDRLGQSASEAASSLKIFVTEGLSESRFVQVGKAAKDMAQVLGIETADAAKQLSKAFTGGFTAIEEFDKATNVLTVSQRENIKTLFEAGKAEQARAEALNIVTQKYDEAASNARGPWSSAATSLANAWDSVVSALARGAELTGITTAFGLLASSVAAATGALDEFLKRAQGIRDLGSVRYDLDIVNQQINAALTAERVGGDPLGLVGAKIKELFEQRAQLLREEAKLNTATKNGLGDPNDPASAANQKNIARQMELLRISEKRLETEKLLGEARVKAEGEIAFKESIAKFGDQALAQAASLLAMKKQQGIEDEKALRLAKEAAKEMKFVAPVSGRISSGFGPRVSPGGFGSTFHKGVDYAVPTGTVVNAPADGVVIETGYDSKLGKFVYIDHGSGTITKFGHLSKNDIVSKGDLVQQGQKIALSGNTGASTGAHLHYTIMVNGKPVDPQKITSLPVDLAEATARLDKAAADAEEKRIAAQKKYNSELESSLAKQGRNAAYARETLGLQGELLIAKQREQAIAEAVIVATENAAKAQVQLTAQQIEAIKQKTAAEFDALNATRAIQEQRRAVETPVTDLSALRDEMQQRIQFLQQIGDSAGADELQIKLDEVNAQLGEAIDTALEFWTTISGNPEALTQLGLTADQIELIRLRLDATKIASEGMKTSFLKNAKDINTEISGGLTNSILAFSKALATGGDALGALKESFLSFLSEFLIGIAKMILQQAIFNALANAGGSGGVGGSIASAIAGLFHSGGMVGNGGQSRSVSPTMFANAARFHTGGFPGLAANEVPAILQKGEEVLTKNDPRHQGNGGGQAQKLTIINTLDAGEVMDAAMNTTLGQKAFINFIRANSRSIKAVLN